MSTPIRWGFLGAGYIASRALGPAVHAADGAVLQAAAARDLDRARALEPSGHSYTDYAAVCADPEVDVVYVALPGNDHLRWTLAALAAGKHVLCEKPLGADAAEVRRMTDAAARADRLLVEAAWNRWHPRTRRLLDLVADEAPRDPPLEVVAAFTFGGVPPDNFRLDPARGGGALYDVGCYCVAVSAALLTAPGQALDVRSVTTTIGPTGVDLTTVAELAGTRGTARITASIDAPEGQQLTVTAGTWGVESVGDAFASWREPSRLRIHDASATRVEQFAAVDAYQCMVEAVSRRVGGDPTAWVLPLAESAATAQTLDRIRGYSRETSA